jgi:hypothetical protein
MSAGSAIQAVNNPLPAQLVYSGEASCHGFSIFLLAEFHWTPHCCGRTFVNMQSKFNCILDDAKIHFMHQTTVAARKPVATVDWLLPFSLN